MFEACFTQGEDQLSEKDKQLIVACIGKAVEISHRVLPDTTPLRINIVADEGGCSADLPVEGLAFDKFSNEMTIIVDPQYPVYRFPDQHKYLISTIAHEWHHGVRSHGPGCGNSLGEMLVSEGLAQAFEAQIVNELPSLATAVSVAECLSFEQHVRKNWWRKRSDLHRDFFIGNQEKGFLQWLGYSFGYALVKAWLPYDGRTAAEAVHIQANEVLQPWLKGKISLREDLGKMLDKIQAPTIQSPGAL